jgi:hypothetical protein
MSSKQAGAIGGLAAGLVMSLAMVVGRRSGVLHKTLAEDAEDWLDRVVDARRVLGQGGTTALEQANHMAASVAFGLGYSLLSERLSGLPAPMLGTLYGAGLYAMNIVGIAPLLGMTEGERNAPGPLRAERLSLHLLYGMLTALIAERLSERRKTSRRKFPALTGR